MPLPHGVVRSPVTPIEDPRGSFREVFRARRFPSARPIAQTNLSTSAAGVLRGMHFHRHQADHWWFVDGEVFIALVDLREGSPTTGAVWWSSVAGPAAEGLFVPPGVAHGFLAVTPTRLLYHVDAEFDGGADEFGFAWDDPDAAIPWPLGGPPTLSERDASNPSLSAVLVDPPAFRPVSSAAGEVPRDHRPAGDAET